mmetsp:Transcript_21073/g.72529  ORF Transcript_21073/g.72529 Transcript_21073/m.72529 type:complete len:466 (+) Transcript_21073:124-1521(+)
MSIANVFPCMTSCDVEGGGNYGQVLVRPPNLSEPGARARGSSVFGDGPCVPKHSRLLSLDDEGLGHLVAIGHIEDEVGHAPVQVIETELQDFLGDLLIAAQAHQELESLLALVAGPLHGQVHDLPHKLRAPLLAQRREVAHATGELDLIRGVEVLQDHGADLPLELNGPELLLAVLRSAALGGIEDQQPAGATDAQDPAAAQEGHTHELVGDHAREELDGEVGGAGAVELQVRQLAQQPRDAPLQVVLGQLAGGREVLEEQEYGLAPGNGVLLREGHDDGLLHELVLVLPLAQLVEPALDRLHARGGEVVLECGRSLELELLELSGDIHQHLMSLRERGFPLGQARVHQVLRQLRQQVAVHDVAGDAAEQHAEQDHWRLWRVDGDVLPGAEKLFKCSHQGGRVQRAGLLKAAQQVQYGLLRRLVTVQSRADGQDAQLVREAGALSQERAHTNDRLIHDFGQEVLI